MDQAAAVGVRPGQPQAERRDVSVEERSIEALVAKVEAHLEANPEDARGWEVVSPVYMRLGRFDDAVKARRNVLRLLGANGPREADLGEALTGAANGVLDAGEDVNGNGVQGAAAEAATLVDARGYPVIQSGRYDEGEHYYLDTEKDFGYIIELGNAGRIRPGIRRYPRYCGSVRPTRTNLRIDSRPCPQSRTAFE